VSESLTKWLLGAVVICLAILIWRIGSPLQLQIVGPFQSGVASGIPLALNMSTPADARYDVEVQQTAKVYSLPRLTSTAAPLRFTALITTGR
jgi:hypothetical protein